MSVGINQLMLGMSYYILGCEPKVLTSYGMQKLFLAELHHVEEAQEKQPRYAMLEVKAPLAALAGVLAFMGSAEATEAVLICPCLLGE